MDQRRVRLGDVLDDYCPRERRVTNHAVVALVGSDIKLTRCTTCDTEHPYKEARVPPRRQTRLVAALSNAGADGALIAAPAPSARPIAPAAPAPSARPIAPAAPAPSARPIAPAAPAAPVPAASAEAEPPPASVPPDVPLSVASPPPTPHVDSVRRPLIRATLGRPDPAAVTRSAPVFTIREHAGRDGNVDREKPSRKRRNGGRPNAEPNGNRADGHPGQFARSGYGQNESKSARGRNGNGRVERFNKSASRSRGKSRSR